MSSKLKVLQVIPRLGYGGAETGCYDLAHYLHEQNCSSYIVTSGGELLKYVNKKKVRIISTTRDWPSRRKKRCISVFFIWNRHFLYFTKHYNFKKVVHGLLYK